MSFDTDPGGKHTVTLKVSLTSGTKHIVTTEYHGVVSKETAIVRAAANVSREMRLNEYQDISFVSYKWDAVGN